MNPFLIAQGIGAAAGLIGGFIPDKTKTVEHTMNVEGSDLAGRVPGAVGAESIATFTKEKYQDPIKKALLTTSKVASTVGSMGSLAKSLIPGLKVPSVATSTLSDGIGEMSNSLTNAASSFSNSLVKNTTPLLSPQQEYSQDIEEQMYVR